MKNKIRDLLLAPPYVRYCSQTIYQALLGCIKLYEATLDVYWENEAKFVLGILLDIQRPDGGFDIGYEFNFGMIHRKGDSTSPEMVGFLALNEFKRVFGTSPTIDRAIEKAVLWIKNNYVERGTKCYYPYSPQNTEEQMVYNGSSFVIGGLGVYLKEEEEDVILARQYEKVNYYLNSVLEDSEKGKLFYYYDQDRAELTGAIKKKVDFYHQAQQVEMHCYAQLAYPNDEQLEIIKSTLDCLEYEYRKENILPYTKGNLYFGGNIHVWGYSSVISAFLIGAKLVEEKKEKYVHYSKEIATWLLSNSFNGEFFFPIVSMKGDVILSKYMVRSDAWVFNSLGSLYKIDKKDELLTVLRRTYGRMKGVNFSGRETHASTKLTRMIVKVIAKLTKK